MPSRKRRQITATVIDDFYTDVQKNYYSYCIYINGTSEVIDCRDITAIAYFKLLKKQSKFRESSLFYKINKLIVPIHAKSSALSYFWEGCYFHHATSYSKIFLLNLFFRSNSNTFHTTLFQDFVQHILIHAWVKVHVHLSRHQAWRPSGGGTLTIIRQMFTYNLG